MRDESRYNGDCKNCTRYGTCAKPCEVVKRRVTQRAAQIFNDMSRVGVGEYLKSGGNRR